jgi:type IV pilus assembly protein PilQ
VAPPTRQQSSEDRALIEAAEALLLLQETPGQTRDLGNPYEARVIGSGEKPYTGEPITLNLKDADVKDTLQKFSELTSLNIVLDPEVRGTVTVSLTDIPWDQALELILKINGLGYVLEGNVMRIAGAVKLAQEESQKQALKAAQEANRPVKTVIQKLSYAPGSILVPAIQKVMTPRGDVYFELRSNSLIIKELPENIPVVLDLIKTLDTPPQQVMIEARVVEATRTFAKQLGVDWSFRGNSDTAHGNTTGLVFPNSGNVTGAIAMGAGTRLLSFSLANVINSFGLDVALSAAESRGLLKVVSSPKVQTVQLVTATIQSGFQIPVQTTINNTTSVLYIDATLRLEVLPYITAEGTVRMDITIQKREPAVGINIASGQNIPLITRDAKTTLLVRDGGTSVIGGIMKLTANNQRNMIPGLWKIPLLGNLFRNQIDREDTDELMIFITPRIMKNS